MNKILLGTAATAMAVMLAGSAMAEPSAKFAAQTNDGINIIDATAGSGLAVLNTKIKTGNKKDLLIGVSLQTSLFTLTKVKGKNGDSDLADALAGITITVKVDGVEAAPGPVIFDERFQELSAVLGGVIESCEDTGTFTDGVYPGEGDDNDTTPDGVITVENECLVTDEEIQLILDTTAAHHFNFVAPNVSSGVHNVTVTADIANSVNAGNGDAQAHASIKVGSLTVQGLRATNNPDGIDVQ